MAKSALKPVILIGVLVLAIALLAWGTYYASDEYRYPYGKTHRCSRALMLALKFYADEHDGRFPSGESSPEASLSLLYPRYIDAETLAGRAGSPERAREILESGGHLGPDTCDWHYVEGLNDNVPPGMVVFWGKADLDHVGKRLYGGHEVAYADGHVKVIHAWEWEDFLAEQKKMLAEFSAQENESATQSSR